MSTKPLADYYNSHVNFDQINPLIRSAYNTTFDFDDYKQKLLAKTDHGLEERKSSLLDSFEEIRREQRLRLAQLEEEYHKQQNTPVFDLPFYPQEEDVQHQKRETIITTKPPIPTASRRSPSPVFVTEEQSPHHTCHRPVSTGILRKHDYDLDFPSPPTVLNSSTSSLHDSSSNHVEHHIHNMWNEHELESYMEKRKPRRPPSAPTKTSWAGRVTKPQPFCLTNSTTMHNLHRKKCLHQHEEERIQKEVEDEMMLHRSFKANPVPAHVRLPLYEQLREEQRARREQLHHMTKEYLHSISKPFGFESREKSKRPSRRHSISGGDTARREPQFKAKPLPDFYYRTTKDIEQMKENSLYRTIKKEVRAKELLRQSRLPSSMQDRDHHTKLRRSMSAEDLGHEEYTFKPKTNGYSIPNYDQLHSDFLRQTEQMKQMRSPTKCKPFLLYTNLIPSRRERILDDMRTEEEMRHLQTFQIKGKQLPIKSRSGMSLADTLQRPEAIPTKTTQSQRMREKLGKKKRREDEIRNKFEEKFQRSRSVRSKRLKENIQERAGLNDKSAVYKAKKEESTRKVRHELHRKEDDYARSLDEMNARVYRRPLLLEQREKDKTVRDLEKQIRHAMHVAKLTEKDLMRQQFNPPNVKVTSVHQDYSA